MITISSIVQTLPAHIVYASSSVNELEIEQIIAGDLMSDMLVTTNTNCLLVTSLATEQTVRTADIICAQAILLVNDKLPTQKMKDLAEESDITLLATPLPMYETCITLGDMERFS